MARPRLVTLNQLSGLRSIDAALEAIAVDDTDHDGTERLQVTIDRIEVADCPALWFTFRAAGEDPEAEIVFGRPLDAREQHSGGVLVIDVDGCLYAISFGQGFRRIQDGYRDQRFGLRVAIRCLDDAQLGELTRPTPVPWLRPGDVSEIVRRIGGRPLPMALTHQPVGDRAAKLLGASGLRLRLALEGDDLVHDLRTITEIHDRPLPRPALAFVDHVAPVADPRTRRQLDADLEDMLGSPDDLQGLAVCVPEIALGHLADTRSYRIDVARKVSAVPDLRLDDITAAVAGVPVGRRLDALTTGRISPCELPGGQRQFARPAAVTWLEATVVIGDRHFVLLDGEWHEFEADFVTRLQSEVAELFTDRALPAWEPGWDEATYCRHLQQADPRYVGLDGEDEALLGPGNEIVQVGRAKGSSTLSRLFARGLVSGLSLTGTGSGDTGTGTGTEKTVVFAIASGTDRPLTPATLFPFAQAALAQAAAQLREHQVRVEVVAIP